MPADLNLGAKINLKYLFNNLNYKEFRTINSNVIKVHESVKIPEME